MSLESEVNMRLEVFVVPVKKVEVMEPEMNAFLRAPRVCRTCR